MKSNRDPKFEFRNAAEGALKLIAEGDAIVKIIGNHDENWDFHVKDHLINPNINRQKSKSGKGLAHRYRWNPLTGTIYEKPLKPVGINYTHTKKTAVSLLPPDIGDKVGQMCLFGTETILGIGLLFDGTTVDLHGCKYIFRGEAMTIQDWWKDISQAMIDTKDLDDSDPNKVKFKVPESPEDFGNNDHSLHSLTYQGLKDYLRTASKLKDQAIKYSELLVGLNKEGLRALVFQQATEKTGERTKNVLEDLFRVILRQKYLADTLGILVPIIQLHHTARPSIYGLEQQFIDLKEYQDRYFETATPQELALFNEAQQYLFALAPNFVATSNFPYKIPEVQFVNMRSSTPSPSPSPIQNSGSIKPQKTVDVSGRMVVVSDGVYGKFIIPVEKLRNKQFTGNKDAKEGTFTLNRGLQLLADKQNNYFFSNDVSVSKRIVELATDFVVGDFCVAGKQRLGLDAIQCQQPITPFVIVKQLKQIYPDMSVNEINGFIEGYHSEAIQMIFFIMNEGITKFSSGFKVKPPAEKIVNFYRENGKMFLEYYAEDFLIEDHNDNQKKIVTHLKAPIRVQFEITKKDSKWGMELVEIESNSNDVIKKIFAGECLGKMENFKPSYAFTAARDYLDRYLTDLHQYRNDNRKVLIPSMRLVIESTKIPSLELINESRFDELSSLTEILQNLINSFVPRNQQEIVKNLQHLMQQLKDKKFTGIVNAIQKFLLAYGDFQKLNQVHAKNLKLENDAILNTGSQIPLPAANTTQVNSNTLFKGRSKFKTKPLSRKAKPKSAENEEIFPYHKTNPFSSRKQNNAAPKTVENKTSQSSVRFSNNSLNINDNHKLKSNFLSHDSIELIKTELGNNWNIGEEQRDTHGSVYLPFNQEREDKNCTFHLYENKMITNDPDFDTFRAMIFAFRAIHGPDVIPEIHTYSVGAKKLWIQACEAANYRPEQLTKITCPDDLKHIHDTSKNDQDMQDASKTQQFRKKSQ